MQAKSGKVEVAYKVVVVWATLALPDWLPAPGWWRQSGAVSSGGVAVTRKKLYKGQGQT